MIVETEVMNFQKIVQNAMQKQILNVPTIGVFQNSGFVILLTIALTGRMKLKLIVKENIEDAQNPNSSVTMANAFPADGGTIFYIFCVFLRSFAT
jgi:hypothetical protein